MFLSLSWSQKIIEANTVFFSVITLTLLSFGCSSFTLFSCYRKQLCVVVWSGWFGGWSRGVGLFALFLPYNYVTIFRRLQHVLSLYVKTVLHCYERTLKRDSEFFGDVYLHCQQVKFCHPTRQGQFPCQHNLFAYLHFRPCCMYTSIVLFVLVAFCTNSFWMFKFS